MKISLALACMISSISHAIAGPPNLECLDELDFQQASSESPWEARPVLLLIDDANLDPQIWESSVWNSPELNTFLDDQGFVVIWIDPHIDKMYFDGFKVFGHTVVRYWDCNSFQQLIRIGLDDRDTTESVIEWLKPALDGSSLRTELRKELNDDPENQGVRWQLLNEERRCYTSGYTRALMYGLLLSLLDNNQSWFEYIQVHEKIDEQQFRSIIIEVIEEFRAETYLFGEPAMNKHNKSDHKGWNGAIAYTEIDNRILNWGKGAMHRVRAVRFLREFETRSMSDTATDRDKFILHALTAEGDDWETLVQEYGNIVP